MTKSSYAPIILFAYRRLDTLKKVIASLKNNNLSKKTEIYIFSDGYKSIEDKRDVLNVRNYLKKIKNFKKTNLCFRKKNFGLAKNIELGVSKILLIKKKGIIIEDDIIVSENFLSFMNQNLNKFRYTKSIWHINGWNYDLKSIKSYNKDIFYWRGMHCWGWATWNDRWKNFKKNPDRLLKSFKEEDIEKFNYDNNYNFWQQIIRNYELKINTWAIFWYATIFQNKGLCASPKESLTFNIGYDEYASHTLKKYSKNHTFHKSKFHSKKIFTFQKKLKENEKIYKQIKKCLKTQKKASLINSLKTIKNFFNIRFNFIF